MTEEQKQAACCLTSVRLFVWILVSPGRGHRYSELLGRDVLPRWIRQAERGEEGRVNRTSNARSECKFARV